MQSRGSLSLPSCSYPCPIPNNLKRNQTSSSSSSSSSLSLLKARSKSSSQSFLSLLISRAPSCRCSIQQNNYYYDSTHSNPTQIHGFFHQFYSSSEAKSGSNQNLGRRDQEEEEVEGEKREEIKTEKNGGLSTNMWWVDLKAALGQRLNIGGIVSSAAVVVKDRHLALPHLFVPDVRYIDWSELHRRGFKGVVFDKDNTITAPYCLTLWAPLKSSLERCKSVFGPDIAVFSNSAGLQEYDHDGSKAKLLQEAIGLKVIRHRGKKPVGTAEEIEKHFGCKCSHLIMVGDRPFTDVVFGNRHGFFTILTEPLSLEGEPFIVRQVRKLEMTLVNLWLKKGTRPMTHRLLPDPNQCVKDPQQ